MVEGRVTGVGRQGFDDDAGDVDDGNDRQQRVVVSPRRVFPELITEQAEPGEEQVYGAAVELVVEWREAWAGTDGRRRTRRTGCGRNGDGWSWSFG